MTSKLRWLLPLIAFWLLSLAYAQSLPREVCARILEAVVQIILHDEQSGSPVSWSGSGSIISPDSYILTNYHVIGDFGTRVHFEYHAVFMTRAQFVDQLLTLSYWAKYVAGDPTHDPAILKMVELLDETPVTSDMCFPFVTVGNSNDLLPGDIITLVGYPGISGSTATFTAGRMNEALGRAYALGSARR